MSRPGGVRSGSGTYGSVCELGLRTLARALGREAELPRIAEMAAWLLEGWSDQLVPKAAPRASRIGDDHSPFEYSLAFDPDGVDLRLLLEAQGTPPSAAGNLHAALELNQRLVERYSADLSRFDAISELFLEESTAEPFSLWHALALGPHCEQEFKQ